MNLDDPYQFKYRLLASADIIGSSAFKSGQASIRKPWAHVFRGFFDEFPKRLAAAFERLDGELAPDGRPSSPFDVWKLVGDEILFCTEIKRHEEVVYHTLALKDALKSYSDELSKKHPGLELKGTIWGAGFPVLNVAVDTQASPGSGRIRDYLGPSVDLGFRLAQFADRRKLVLSADVALFLTIARASSAACQRSLFLFLDPPQILKGINAGGPYPIFWIDRLDGKATHEDLLLGRERKVEPDALHQYLESLFSLGTVGLMRPFIETDPSPNFRQIPDEFKNWRDAIRKDDVEYQYLLGKATPKSQGAKRQPPLPSQVPAIAQRTTKKNLSKKRSRSSSRRPGVSRRK